MKKYLHYHIQFQHLIIQNQIRDLNQGTFGFVELAWDKYESPPQQVAVKFLERGEKVLLLLILILILI